MTDTGQIRKEAHGLRGSLANPKIIDWMLERADDV